MKKFRTTTTRVPTGNGRWTAVSIAEPRHPTTDTPLLLLHGGPGGTNHRFKPLIKALAATRVVICFDQLGGQGSTTAIVGDLEVSDFVDQVAAVRQGLKLDCVDLLGHSWGGMLALEHLAQGRTESGVRSLVLSSTPADMDVWAFETALLRDDLCHDLGRLLEERAPRRTNRQVPASQPGSVQSRVRAELLRVGWFAATRPAAQRAASKLAKRGLLRDPSTAIAEVAYLRAHGCVMDWPPISLFEGTVARNRAVYEHLWGVDETNGTGPLRSWTMPASVDLARIPTLLLRGEFDETTAAHHDLMTARYPHARASVIGGAGHVAMIERPHRYATLVQEFLDEAARPSEPHATDSNSQPCTRAVRRGTKVGSAAP